MGSRGGSGRSVRAEIEATVVVGGRLYLFTLYLEASDARAVFDAYASTIDLRPEEAASPAPSYRMGHSSRLPASAESDFFPR